MSVDNGDADKAAGAHADENLAPPTLHAAEFPRITPGSTKVTSGDNPSVIEGDLTMVGVTAPLPTPERPRNPSGNNKERCGGNATGKISAQRFGVKPGNLN